MSRLPPTSCCLRRRTLGKAWVVVVVVLAVLTGVGGSTYLIVKQNRTAEAAPEVPGDPMAEIIALQEEFKRYSENQLDMVNLLPAVSAYTKKYPEEFLGHLLLGQVLLKLELYRDAYNALNTALKLEPDDFKLLHLTGTCAAMLDLWEEAERHLTAADAQQEELEVILQLANLYYQTGRLDEAEEAYRRAVRARTIYHKIPPPPHEAHAGLAEVYAARQEYDLAIEEIEWAIRWVDGDSEGKPWVYQLNLVRLQFDAGLWEDGENTYESIKVDEENGGAMLALPAARLRARLHAHHGRHERAAGELALILTPGFAPPGQTDDELADILAEHAHWCLEAGDTAQAATRLNNLRKLRPDHPRLAELEARVSREQ